MKPESSVQGALPAEARAPRGGSPAKGKIWIDLENSPHVPFFAPIIDELRRRGCTQVLTARDCFQVRELADFFHLDYQLAGHHPGKSNVRKMAALCLRATKLIPLMRKERPDLAVSHGSRSQLIASSWLGIPTLMIRDYEFSTPLPWLRPTWMMCPEIIPSENVGCDARRVLKYPGIKEDVYVPRFTPDDSIRSQLGLNQGDVVATIRPPASEAHYHNPQSDGLFNAVVSFLSRSAVKAVVLPRDEKQSTELQRRWPALFASGAMRIPARVVDGLNLIWHSDLVISGGGTMNREAAALGVPVYSVFRGKIGAVDRYLAEQGRLVLLESVGDVEAKVVVRHRERCKKPQNGGNATLRSIVEHIAAIMDAKGGKQRTSCECDQASTPRQMEVGRCEESGLPAEHIIETFQDFTHSSRTL
jgi:uncharacterized protein